VAILESSALTIINRSAYRFTNDFWCIIPTLGNLQIKNFKKYGTRTKRGFGENCEGKFEVFEGNF